MIDSNAHTRRSANDPNQCEVDVCVPVKMSWQWPVAQTVCVESAIPTSDRGKGNTSQDRHDRADKRQSGDARSSHCLDIGGPDGNFTTNQCHEG